MEDDYFFAPRPKFAMGARWVRGFAVVYAVVVSAYFCLSYLTSFTTYRTEFAQGYIAALEPTDWIVAVLIHTLMLVPAWRSWNLQRCGVLFITIVFAVLAFITSADMANADDGLSWKMGLVGLVSWLVLFLWLACVADQWPHLKPNF